MGIEFQRLSSPRQEPIHRAPVPFLAISISVFSAAPRRPLRTTCLSGVWRHSGCVFCGDASAASVATFAGTRGRRSCSKRLRCAPAEPLSDVGSRSRAASNNLPIPRHVFLRRLAHRWTGSSDCDLLRPPRAAPPPYSRTRSWSAHPASFGLRALVFPCACRRDRTSEDHCHRFRNAGIACIQRTFPSQVSPSRLLQIGFRRNILGLRCFGRPTTTAEWVKVRKLLLR